MFYLLMFRSVTLKLHGDRAPQRINVSTKVKKYSVKFCFLTKKKTAPDIKIVRCGVSVLVVSLFDHDFADLSALTANVEAVFGVVYADSLKVEVFDR